MERLPIQAGNWDQLLHFLGIVHAANGALEAPLTIGSGDNVTGVTANTTDGQLTRLYKGTAASPDTTLQPLVQIGRIANATQTQVETASGTVGNTGAEQLCALKVTVDGTAATEAQMTGIVTIAHAYGTTGALYDDGTGLEAFGVSEAGNTGNGIGLGGHGVRLSTATGSGLTGCQLFAVNVSGSASTYNSTGFTPDSGLAIFCGGTGATNNMGAAVQVMPNNTTGNQFEVGIGIPGVANGAATGAIKNSTFRDDGAAAVSLDIRGTHATAALQIASGSGHVGIGTTAASTVLIFAVTEADATMGMQIRQHSATQSADLFRASSSTPAPLWSIAGWGDTVWADAINMVFGTTTGTKIGTATSQKLAFYNSTPVVQQTASADATTSAAGSTTTVFTTTTFTGGTGSSAYSVGGIVKALKTYGLLAA